MTDDLYDRPDLYDLMAPSDPAMQAFYVDAARERGGQVLDLACGTGRLTIPLAQAGLAVTGGDLSERMLARARSAAASSGVRIAFHALDMRDFALPTQFDSIIVGANSLMHLLTLDDIDSVLRAVARHLTPGGQLLFDVFVPSAEMLARRPEERHPVAQFETESGPVSVDETIRYDPAVQISHVEWIWSRPSAPDFWRHPLSLRQYYPQEIPLLLERHGLRLTARFGDFDRTGFGATSRRQVCMAGR